MWCAGKTPTTKSGVSGTRAHRAFDRGPRSLRPHWNVGDIVSFPANGLADPNLLRVGSTILVPGRRIEPSAADDDESG